MLAWVPSSWEMDLFWLPALVALHPIILLLNIFCLRDPTLSWTVRCIPFYVSFVLWAPQLIFWSLSVAKDRASFAPMVYLMTVWCSHWTEVSASYSLVSSCWSWSGIFGLDGYAWQYPLSGLGLSFCTHSIIGSLVTFIALDVGDYKYTVTTACAVPNLSTTFDYHNQRRNTVCQLRHTSLYDMFDLDIRSEAHIGRMCSLIQGMTSHLLMVERRSPCFTLSRPWHRLNFSLLAVARNQESTIWWNCRAFPATMLSLLSLKECPNLLPRRKSCQSEIGSITLTALCLEVTSFACRSAFMIQLS